MRRTALAALLSLLAAGLARTALAEDAGPADADAGVGDPWAVDPDAFPGDDGVVYETVIRDRPPEEDGLSRRRIDREEIRETGSVTAIEAVEREPAVFAASGKKGERSFRLRGFDQRGVAVYLDGVPFAMPYSGSIDLGKIPAQMLGSILLLKGPTSVAFGPGGMGGALLLETRDPAGSPQLEVELTLSRDAETGATLYHARDAGPFAYAIGAGTFASDGYSLSAQFEPTEYEDGGGLDNSDRRLRHAAGKLVVPMPGPNRFVAQAFVVDGELGVPRSTTDTRPFFSRFDYWRGAVGQVAHELDTRDTAIAEALYVAAFDNRLDAYDNETFTTQDGANAYSSWYHDRTFGGRITARQAFRGLPGGATYVRLWAGAQNDTHRATLDADQPQEEFSRTLITAVPELEIPIVRGLVALASAQTDVELTRNAGEAIEGWDGALRDETTAVFGPLLSLRWDPRADLMLRASAARRNRIPTLSERYSSRLGFTQPNPELGPESAWHFGLDASWTISRGLDLDLSGFDAEVADLIVSEYLPEMNGVTQKQNVGRARLAGGEAAIAWRPARLVELTAGYAYLYARRLDTGAGEEEEIAQIPAHQAIFGLALDPKRWLRITSSLRVVGPQAFDDYTILGLGELGTYAVWDARIEASPAPWCSVWLHGSNLLDMNYQTQYGYPDRGLNVWVGVRATVR
jgi:iron complex outermembrane receptor protein